MVDWIHCNSCYRQPGSGKQFLLTDCGHIFCQDCQSLGVNQLCKVCNETSKSTPLTSEMSPDVAIYFTDPTDLLQKQLKHLNQTIQVIEFQKNHRKRLSLFNCNRMQNFKQKISDAMAAVEKMQVMTLEMQRLQEELKAVKQELDYLRQLLKMYKGRKSPYSTTGSPRAAPSLDTSGVMYNDALNNSSRRSSRASDKDNRELSSLEDGILPSHPRSLNNSSQSAPWFSFRTPNSVSHISPGINRLNIRTPPSNGKLGVIPHYPASGNLNAYTSTMSSVRELASPREAASQQISKPVPATDPILARLHANYPHLKT